MTGVGTAAARGRPAWRVALVALVVALAAVQAAVFAWLIPATAITQPYDDIYALIDQAFHLRDGHQGFLDYLWTAHAGHHIPWARLLLLWDMTAFHGRGWPTILASALALAVSAALLAREAWRAAPAGGRAASAALAAMTGLTGIAAFDASQPVFSSYPLALVFVVLAIVLFAAERSPVARVAGMACAMAAALGNGVGLAVWPALLFLAVRSDERRWAWTAAVALAAAAFAFVYLDHAAALTPTGAAQAGPGDRLVFGLSFFGLPISQLYGRLGAVAGMAFLVAAAAVAAATRLGAGGRSQRVAIALMGFSLGATVLAALGRVDVGGATLRPPVRYAPLLTPLHVGLLIGVLGFSPRRLGLLPLLAGMAVCALVLVRAQQHLVSNDLTTAATIRAALADYRAGGRDHARLVLVNNDIPLAERLDARLRREGLFQP